MGFNSEWHGQAQLYHQLCLPLVAYPQEINSVIFRYKRTSKLNHTKCSPGVSKSRQFGYFISFL